MLDFRSATNPVGVTFKLIQNLGVKVSRTTVANQLEDHPEYPSLLAISDCLTEWGMPNQAYQIDKKDVTLADFEYPFIAHLNTGGGTYAVVHQIDNSGVIYSDEKANNAVMTAAQFVSAWSGVVLHAERNEKSGEPNYSLSRTKETLAAMKVPALVLLVLGAVLLAISSETVTLGYLALIIAKFAGVAVTTLLLAHSVDANNPLVQNLCSLGKKNNCNAVLKSDAAKVFSWLTWSEVGFFYFLGTTLSLLIVPASLPLIAWMNIFALPYTIYSISYQYSQKNWCVLCCVVQGVLLLEFAVNFFSAGNYTLQGLPMADWRFACALLISFLLPIFAWFAVKPLLTQSTLVKPLKGQLKKFKYNSDLFNQILMNQPKYGVSDELMPIKMGNPNAETTITMVSNPFCGPCAKAHQEIDEWLKYRTDFQLKIIFTTADHDNDERTKISRHINALSLLQDTELLERALNDWYNSNQKKYEAWAAKYPITFNGEMREVTAKQKAWCEMAEIKHTPTILVNGYKLPEPYRLEDIKYLLS